MNRLIMAQLPAGTYFTFTDEIRAKIYRIYETGINHVEYDSVDGSGNICRRGFQEIPDHYAHNTKLGKKRYHTEVRIVKFV